MLFGRPRRAPEVVRRLEGLREYGGVAIRGYDVYRRRATLRGAYVEVVPEFTKSSDYKVHVLADDGVTQVVSIEVREGYVTALVVGPGGGRFAVVAADEAADGQI